jgi:hypothetical protein
MRRIIIGAVLVAATVFVPVGSASAHVHGITPLLRCGSDLDGADRTDTTPAAAANGGPIVGLIPRDVGNTPLDIGDGGFDAPACDASSG